VKDHLEAVIDKFTGTQVAVLGDLVLDEFHYGEISRVSREAPVLIIDHLRNDAMPGGGANAVDNVRALGGIPIPVGVVGQDEEGDRLLAIFEKRGIKTSGVTRLEGYSTPTKTRVLAGLAHSRPQQVIRIDRGATGSVPRDAASAAADRAREIVSDGSVPALLISDYGYDVVTPGSTAGLLEGNKNIVTCDSRHRLRGFKGVTASTPNLEEAEEILGRRFDPDESGVALQEAGRHLLEMLGSRGLLITKGNQGMTLLEDGVAPFDIPVFGHAQVADVTGAGDTVIATFTLALATGATFRLAAILANCAAGLVVMKRGTATVTSAELKEAVGRLEIPGGR
jgi:rfaE bifunctional protein kinase chain/domain